MGRQDSKLTREAVIELALEAVSDRIRKLREIEARIGLSPYQQSTLIKVERIQKELPSLSSLKIYRLEEEGSDRILIADPSFEESVSIIRLGKSSSILGKEAPILASLLGKEVGDMVSFNERQWKLLEIL